MPVHLGSDTLTLKMIPIGTIVIPCTPTWRLTGGGESEYVTNVCCKHATICNGWVVGHTFLLCEQLAEVPRPITGNIFICIVNCKTAVVVVCECILRTSYLVLISWRHLFDTLWYNVPMGGQWTNCSKGLLWIHFSQESVLLAPSGIAGTDSVLSWDFPAHGFKPNTKVYEALSH